MSIGYPIVIVFDDINEETFIEKCGKTSFEDVLSFVLFRNLPDDEQKDDIEVKLRKW